MKILGFDNQTPGCWTVYVVCASEEVQALFGKQLMIQIVSVTGRNSQSNLSSSHFPSRSDRQFQNLA